MYFFNKTSNFSKDQIVFSFSFWKSGCFFCTLAFVKCVNLLLSSSILAYYQDKNDKIQYFLTDGVFINR